MNSKVNLSTTKNLALALLAVALFPAFVPAAIIQYTFSGEGSGSLDGNLFPYTTVSITATFDTGQVQDLHNGAFVLPWTPGATLSVSGVGTGRFEAPTQIFAVATGGTIGISGIDVFGGVHDIAYMGALGDQLQGYDLSTPMDPFPSYNFVGMSGPYATTAGDFIIGSWFPAFRATVVPEPGNIPLYALATLALGVRFLVLKSKVTVG